MVFDEDYRRHQRIKEQTPVQWRIEGTDRKGSGLVRDISVSGILLEMDTFFTPNRNSIFLLEPIDKQEELFIPEQAVVVWAKPMKLEMGKYLCGLEFVKPSDHVIANISRRIEKWLVKIAETANFNILSNYFKQR